MLRITRSLNREEIRQYEYLKPLSFWKVATGGTQCQERWPGTEVYLCTLAVNHPEPHAAFGPFGVICAVWDREAARMGPGLAAIERELNKK